MLLALGQFVFSTDSVSLASLTRKRDYSFAETSIADGRSHYQYTGVGTDSIELPFVVYETHGIGRRQSIEDIAEMASTGAGYVLMDGTGYIYGVYIIDTVEEKKSYLTQTGTPLKLEGSIKLTRVDEARVATDPAPTP
ncbi:MAG: phage tail protein [Moraxella sp.]|nr:phage tail protein [Moraxella sp.]